MAETASDRRKRKLTQLCADRGLDAVAVAAGVSPAYIDQILKGTLLPAKRDGGRSVRQLGDDAARRIEAKLGLGHAWFDEADGLEKYSAEALELADAYQSIRDESERRRALLVARLVLTGRTQAALRALALTLEEPPSLEPESQPAEPTRQLHSQT